MIEFFGTARVGFQIEGEFCQHRFTLGSECPQAGSNFKELFVLLDDSSDAGEGSLCSPAAVRDSRRRAVQLAERGVSAALAHGLNDRFVLFHRRLASHVKKY